MVQYETNAYIFDESSAPRHKTDMPGLLFKDSLSDEASAQSRRQVPKVIEAGFVVPNSSIVKLKCTNTAHRSDLFPDIIQQMCLSRIFTIYRGRETNGRILKTPEIHTLDEKFRQLEVKDVAALRKLVILIKNIRGLVENSSAHRVSLLHDGIKCWGQIQVFESDGQGMMLSNEVKERFWE